ncbi:MAG: membrane protein insertion efficiency factor YidD [Succinivibrionaceae bacterium]
MLIVFYQHTLSHIIGNQCRFYPTCSEYTKQAILIHGFFYGCFLGLKRIIKCNPLNKGGVDIVPPSKGKFSKK